MTRRRTIPVLGLALSAVLVPASAFASETDAWVSNGPPGASVFAIAPAPSNPATVYAATGRGVWRGQRGGALWRNASAGLPGVRVQTLAVDPTNPAVLYAGTITPTGIQSVGIFKSTDGGASWIEANAGLFDPFTQAEPLDVPAISIDPTNPQVLLAGTRFSEIFRSEDGGASWEPQTLGGAGLGLETTGFARDPANPQRIYAASSEGLLLSTNGGQDWDFFGDAGISFFTIAVDPSTPSTVWAGNVNNFGVGRSTDSGATWQSANGNLPKVTVDGVDFFPPIRAVAVAPDGSAVYLATQAAGLFQERRRRRDLDGARRRAERAELRVARLPSGPAAFDAPRRGQRRRRLPHRRRGRDMDGDVGRPERVPDHDGRRSPGRAGNRVRLGV